MSKINLTKNLTKEEIVAEAVKIESDARANKDGSKISYLDECLREAQSNSELRDKILVIRTTIEAEIARAAVVANQAPTNVFQIQPPVVSVPAPAEKIAAIAEDQEVAIGELNTLLKKNGVEAWDREGNKIENPAGLEIKHGKPGVVGAIRGMSDDDIKLLMNSLDSIYEKFAELGVKIKKHNIEVEGVGQSKDAFICTFAMEVPKGYSGNRNPMTMNEGQIAEFLDALSKTNEREICSDRCGFGSKEQWQGMLKESKEWEKGFLNELTSRVVVDVASSDRAKELWSDKMRDQKNTSVFNSGRGSGPVGR